MSMHSDSYWFKRDRIHYRTSLDNDFPGDKMLIDNVFQLASVMNLTEISVETILRQGGYKITPQRRAVLAAIAVTHDQLTPAHIHEKIRQKHPGIGLVTVYRTLEILDKLGLICEVHSAGGCRSYLMRNPSKHHHHIVCSHCGVVTDFTGCDLSDLAERLSRETGFEIEEHILEFSGRCRSCRNRNLV